MEEVSLQNLKIKKSNALLSAKFKSSLLENLILSISLSRTESIDGQIQATLYPSEIKSLIGDNSHAIYDRLKQVAGIMHGHTMIFEDGKGNFHSFNAITNADYVEGKFTLTFNKQMGPLLGDLTSNYTLLELSQLVNFRSNQSYRLFEILRKELYRYKGEPIRFEIGLAELKCTIGLVNLDEEGVKRKINSYKDHIDWEEVYDIAIEKSYNGDWYDFKRRVLERAKEEIAEKTDIVFTYQPVKSGKKVKKVVFFISPNPNYKIQVEKAKKLAQKDSQYNINSVIYRNLYEKYEGHNYLQREELDIFISEAKGDENLVMRAIELADKESNLENYPGWIIACIRRGGYTNQPAMQGDTDKAVAINNLISSTSTSNDAAFKVYQRQTSREEYPEFLASLGMETLDEFELVYSDVAERVKLFSDWAVHRK